MESATSSAVLGYNEATRMLTYASCYWSPIVDSSGTYCRYIPVKCMYAERLESVVS